MYILSEKEFVIDYYNFYPVMEDFQKLLDLYPELYPFNNTKEYLFFEGKYLTL